VRTGKCGHPENTG